MSTDEQITYTTKNCSSFLRGHESIVLRLANQQQYEMILSMNKKQIPSLLKFECIICFTKIPLLAHSPSDTTIASGVAKPKLQGQATTSIVTNLIRLSEKSYPNTK